MLEFCEQQFELAKPDQKGIPLRDHLEVVKRTTGKTPDELVEKPIPYQLSYLWQHFLSLNTARGSGMNGPLPISFSEIKAWSDLTATPVNPLEVEILKKIDNLYVRIANG